MICINSVPVRVVSSETVHWCTVSYVTITNSPSVPRSGLHYLYCRSSTAYGGNKKNPATVEGRVPRDKTGPTGAASSGRAAAASPYNLRYTIELSLSCVPTALCVCRPYTVRSWLWTAVEVAHLYDMIYKLQCNQATIVKWLTR